MKVAGGQRPLGLKARRAEMRIKDIEVDGFGVWNGVKLTDLPPGVTVLYGPN
jgi:hypothetical protein